ncbi:MAG TPA: 2-hydroxyglutaryl-CoA dehydratase, partial [Dehalococcoidia bacterium]|nr:2-hydroxyglutaryl-CoA dehydratase [Dehalococcoidia bacterium]
DKAPVAVRPKGAPEEGRAQHWKRPAEYPFLASERPYTTILYSGLTPIHEEIVKGIFESEGLNMERLPVADNEAMMVGQEFCNRGQCNPHFYTIGNIIKYLRQRQAEGLSVEEVQRRYVVVWGSDCGPCRMGMYEGELRKALKAAGFPCFRVAILDVGHGLDLNQSGREPGLALTPRFFLKLARANMAADIINDLAYQVRPYEVEPGATDAVVAQAMGICREAIRRSSSLVRALRRVRRLFDAVETDYTRVRPRVLLTGEFWLKLTEGDGNYRLARWLEAEGAEVIMDPVGAWFEYMIWLNQLQTGDRRRVRSDRYGLNGAKPWLILPGLAVGRRAYETLYNLYRAVMGFKPDPLPNMKLLERYAEGYYERRLIAGEGHLEVTKHIYTLRHKKAHMVITIKPFGCMPSNLSDGVQAKVVTDYPDSLYLAIETTGDGEVLVKSRVQMKLYEARRKAKEELEGTMAAYGVSLEEVQEHARAHRLNRGMLHIPYGPQGAATAARFAALVARGMGRRPGRDG